MHTIESIIHKCDKAIIAENFDELMDYYTQDAILIVQPGTKATGKKNIRAAFEKIAVYFKHGLQVSQTEMEILESGDTALVLANTLVEAPKRERELRQSTYVFTKTSGRWLCSIDNSYGHQILQTKL